LVILIQITLIKILEEIIMGLVLEVPKVLVLPLTMVKLLLIKIIITHHLALAVMPLVITHSVVLGIIMLQAPVAETILIIIGIIKDITIKMGIKINKINKLISI